MFQQKTWEKASRAIKCDWFSFTTKRKLTDVLRLFDSLPEPLVHKQSGLYGYKLSFASSSGVIVLFSPERDDIHVQLSGSGVDCYSDFYDMIRICADEDKVSRIDIALDCIGSGVTCADIWGVLQQNAYRSCSSSIRKFEGLLPRNSQSETNPGRLDYTIYIGSVKSERMVRIYDKGAESGTDTDWLRYEVQLRSSSARGFYLLAKKAASPEIFKVLCLEMINKQIRLLDAIKDKNDNLKTEKLHPFGNG